MDRNPKSGFTIIELMVALVVGGLLMAVLVGLAGSVQKTFGRTRDITELQANLRFAMRAMVEDFSRAAFMYAPDPERDPHRWGPYGTMEDAVAQDATGTEITLRGNYVSSRDYRVALDNSTTATVLCRNGAEYVDSASSGPSAKECKHLGSYEPYLEPFFDGPGMTDLFCEGELLRLDVGDRHYMYMHVQSVNESQNQVTFQEVIDRDRVKGAQRTSATGALTDMHSFWLNPITAVTYQLADGGSPPPYGDFGTVRYTLNRITDDCRDRPLSELVEFMLPPIALEADTPGLRLRVFRDVNWGEGAVAGPWVPSINFATPEVFPGGTVDWPQVRAVAIELRARTEVEDPNFVLSGYPSAAAKNFGYDLDGNSKNGLAHVRLETTMVELRNMALASSPAKVE